MGCEIIEKGYNLKMSQPIDKLYFDLKMSTLNYNSLSVIID